MVKVKNLFLTCRLKSSFAELEWMLKTAGAVPSTIEKDPKQKVKDVLMSQLRNGRGDSDDDDDYLKK